MREVLAVLLAGPAAALGAYSLNWLELISWRRARRNGAHWSEQARLLWPTSIAGQSFLWILPLGFALLAGLILPSPSSATLACVGAFAAIGATCGTLPRDREIFPRYTWPELGRQASIVFVLRSLSWLVLIGAAVAMPREFGWTGAAITTAVLVHSFTWPRFIWPRIGWAIGVFAPAPPRLQKIVDEMAQRTGVPYRRVTLLGIGGAQALALVNTRELVFTKRILAVLDDQELASIAAHELAHLTEGPGVRSLRTLAGYVWIPCIFVRPLVALCGPVGYVIPWLIAVSVPFLVRPLFLRMETRADAAAKTWQSDEGVYARALLKIHEDNLIPVVFPEGRHTHPHLYDRLTAAGSTPDFPRPAPAEKFSLSALVVQIAIGILIAALVLTRGR